MRRQIQFFTATSTTARLFISNWPVDCPRAKNVRMTVHHRGTNRRIESTTMTQRMPEGFAHQRTSRRIEHEESTQSCRVIHRKGTQTGGSNTQSTRTPQPEGSGDLASRRRGSWLHQTSITIDVYQRHRHHSVDFTKERYVAVGEHQR